jgi:predicted nucleic acid-binding protein
MISYDANVLIYFFESHPEFGRSAQRVLAEGAQQGVVLSTVIWQEVLTGFLIANPKVVPNIKASLEALDRTTYLPVTTQIAALASELSAETNTKIKGADALHVATAIANNARVFYTNDKQLIALNTVRHMAIRPLL